MDITLLIGTCDSYSILWDNFVVLADKYFKVNCNKYFVTENKITEYKGYKTIIPGNLPWSDRMLYALNTINTKYTLFVLEDYYFTEPLDESEISMHIDFMESVNANKAMLEIKCNRAYNLDHYGYTNTNKEICKLNANSDYLTSVQPSIWKTAHLKNCMVPGWSPWDFEIKGTELIRNKETDTYLIVRQQKPYWNAVRKGMKLSEGWADIKARENLKDIF